MISHKNLSIIIPAAGIGRRMKSHGPKPLIELNGYDTVLSRQIRLLRAQYPKAEIIVVVGFQADKIIRIIPTGIKIVENESYEESNVVRSIAMGLRVATHDRVLIVYGDLVFNSAALTNVVSHNESTILIDSKGQMAEEEVGVTVVDGKITYLSYGLKTKWAQILYLVGKELNIFKSLVYDRDKTKFYTFEILNTLIERGGELKAIEPKMMKIVEVDSSKDIEMAMRV